MLILNRKVNESFVLHTSDGDITVVLKQISGRNTAQIGIDAPRSVNIVRSELEPVTCCGEQLQSRDKMGRLYCRKCNKLWKPNNCKHNWKECASGYYCTVCDAHISHAKLREKQRAARKTQVDN